ncbi:protein IQ-DOMAIN 14-like [Sorghum bicolor]|uniref:protein IQ-DOMAIN 14-like n=1 Tax=Sorghum bicolor TaxID=4558 RepID=UPI000B424086|nr:protein IQ-DOMAIN 14-like [Sorghum bicolor]|eukprot:XP_021309267.1 protein IQ-DOMAIN 14-like [Sorghum bicolor]
MAAVALIFFPMVPPPSSAPPRLAAPEPVNRLGALAVDRAAEPQQNRGHDVARASATPLLRVLGRRAHVAISRALGATLAAPSPGDRGCDLAPTRPRPRHGHRVKLRPRRAEPRPRDVAYGLTEPGVEPRRVHVLAEPRPRPTTSSPLPGTTAPSPATPPPSRPRRCRQQAPRRRAPSPATPTPSRRAAANREHDVKALRPHQQRPRVLIAKPLPRRARGPSRHLGHRPRPGHAPRQSRPALTLPKPSMPSLPRSPRPW